MFKNNHYKIHISNFKTGKELRMLFANELKVDLKTNSLRLIFKGCEILDEHFLYFFAFDQDNNKIQAVSSPIFEEEKEKEKDKEKIENGNEK